MRGRVIAYDAMSGRELWHFDAVPRPGEPGSENMAQYRVERCRWPVGAYVVAFALDPSSGELFIPVGNPIPDFVPAERLG